MINIYYVLIFSVLNIVLLAVYVKIFVLLFLDDILQGAGVSRRPVHGFWFFDREDPYWFKRSTSFLGILGRWSRCQHLGIRGSS